MKFDLLTFPAVGTLGYLMPEQNLGFKHFKDKQNLWCIKIEDPNHWTSELAPDHSLFLSDFPGANKSQFFCLILIKGEFTSILESPGDPKKYESGF